MRADHAALFQKLHQPYGARVPDRKARLELRGRRIIRLDDEPGRIVRERIDAAGGTVVVFERRDVDVEQVVGPSLCRPERDQPGELCAGDQRALRADRLRCIDRQIEHVAAAEQTFGPGHVEDRARVDLRTHRKRDPRRNVGLDDAGDDVDRRALGCDDEVDARRSRELGDAADRRLDFGRRDRASSPRARR